MARNTKPNRKTKTTPKALARSPDKDDAKPDDQLRLQPGKITSPPFPLLINPVVSPLSVPPTPIAPTAITPNHLHASTSHCHEAFHGSIPQHCSHSPHQGSYGSTYTLSSRPLLP